MAEPRPDGPARLRSTLPALAILALATATYLDALPGAFISDDEMLVVKNQALRGSHEWLSWFGRHYYWGSKSADTSLYRPLTILSFLLTTRVAGVHPLPLLLGNLILHASASLLVFVLGRRLVGAPGAWIGALLFAVHPLHTEAVAWIAGRPELLAAVGALGAGVLALRATAVGEPHPGRYTLGATAAYLAALLSKEHVAPLPVWVLLLYWVDRPRRAGRWVARLMLGMALALAVVLVLRARATTPVSVSNADLFNPAVAVPAWQRWLTAAAVVARYAGLFVWPARLSVDYSYAQILPSARLGPLEAAGLALIVASLAAVVLAARRAPGFALAVAFAPVTFVVVSNFPFAIGTIMAERLTYLPSAGLCWIAGWGIARLWPEAAMAPWRGSGTPPGSVGGGRGAAAPEPSPRPGPAWRAAVGIGLVILVVAGLGMRSVVRNLDWQSWYALYTAAARVSPRSANVHGLLMVEEMVRGDLAKARAHAEEARRLYPRVTAAEAYNFGIVLLRLGEADAAEAQLREATRLSPRFSLAHQALGWLALQRGRPGVALHAYRDAVRAEPDNADAIYGMALAALAAGDRDAARTYAAQAAAAGVQVPEAFWRAAAPLR